MLSKHIATKEDLAKFTLKRYLILQQLYRESELSVSQIAENLHMDNGNVSRYIDDLETQGLVTTREVTNMRGVTKRGHPMAGGRPKKLCSLTMRVWRIMELYEAEPMVDPSKGQVEQLLALIENRDLSTDFRAFVASKFLDIAVEHPDAMLKNDQVKSLFEKVATGDSEFEEKIIKALRSALATSLAQQMLDRETREWFNKEIRGALLKKVSEETADMGAKEWVTNTLARVARASRDRDLQANTINQFLDVYFKGGSNSENVKNELLMFEPEFQTLILEKTRTYAANPTHRSRAEGLLTALISLWMSSELSRK